jgi:hypothetical protein
MLNVCPAVAVHQQGRQHPSLYAKAEGGHVRAKCARVTSSRENDGRKPHAIHVTRTSPRPGGSGTAVMTMRR